MTELLVSLALSAFLFLGIEKFIVYYRGVERQMGQLLSAQENFRFVSHVLSHEISTAGYLGCARLSDQFPISNHVSEGLTQQMALNIYSSSRNNLPSFLKNKVSLGTDAISIRKASLRGADFYGALGGKLILSGLAPRFSKGEVVLLSDCSHAETFRVERAVYSLKDQRQTLYLNAKPSFQYVETAKIYPLLLETFYVAKKDALYQTLNDKRTQELSENVSAMRAVHYGRLLDLSIKISGKNVHIKIPLRDL